MGEYIVQGAYCEQGDRVGDQWGREPVGEVAKPCVCIVARGWEWERKRERGRGEWGAGGYGGVGVEQYYPAEEGDCEGQECEGVEAPYAWIAKCVGPVLPR